MGNFLKPTKQKLIVFVIIFSFAAVSELAYKYALGLPGSNTAVSSQQSDIPADGVLLWQEYREATAEEIDNIESKVWKNYLTKAAIYIILGYLAGCTIVTINTNKT